MGSALSRRIERHRVGRALLDPGKSVRWLTERVSDTYYRRRGQSDYVAFVVLTRSRTGSTLLVTTLDSHPEIRCGEELFQLLRRLDAGTRLNRTFSPQAPGVSARGFKIFYYHPLDSEVDVFALLRDVPNLKVIHLVREDVLATIISSKVAEATDQWRATNNTGVTTSSPAAIDIAADVLQAEFEATESMIARGCQNLSGFDWLDVTYEAFTSDSATELARIQDFLGVAQMPMRSPLRQQRRSTKRDQLANYDELATTFAGTPWGRFFDEP